MSGKQIPEGYMENAQGHLIPMTKVSDLDKARDDVVKGTAFMAETLRDGMVDIKKTMTDDMQAFIDLSAEQYDVKLGGEKGNVTLYSYDGQYKVQRAIAENIQFGEQLLAAKALIDECLREWTDGGNDNVKALIDHAFQVDKQGKISTGRILGLRRLDITDERWLRAMEAISDSIQVVDSKAYIRVYERDEDGEYQPIVLDFAGV